MNTVLLRCMAWLLVMAIAGFTLLPIAFRPVTGMPVDIERFAAFVLLGGTFCLAHPQHRLLVLLGIIGGAGLLEILQTLAPGRHGLPHDALIKILGATLGGLGSVGQLPHDQANGARGPSHAAPRLARAEGRGEVGKTLVQGTGSRMWDLGGEPVGQLTRTPSWAADRGLG